MKKQAGIVSMISLLIVLSFISVMFTQYLQYERKENIKQNSASFYNRLLFLKTQIHAYMTDRYQSNININSPGLFPASLLDLEGAYVPACTSTENKLGNCQMIDQTPWGSVTYAVNDFLTVDNETRYRATLKFTLPDKTLDEFKSEHIATISMLARMPNVIYDEASNEIEMRIERPDMAFAYDSLVKRSGDDSTLLGDWDIGGQYAVTNATDYTITNSDGSQKSVAMHLSTTEVVKHGGYINKPSCPSFLQPDIILTIGNLSSSTEFTAVGNRSAYIMSESADKWRIGLDYVATKKVDSQRLILHEGDIIANIVCR